MSLRRPTQALVLLQILAALPSTSPWTIPGYKQYRAIPSRLNPLPRLWRRQEVHQAPPLLIPEAPTEDWEQQLLNGGLGNRWHFSNAAIAPAALPIMQRGLAWVGGVNRAAGASLAGLGRYGLLALTPPPAVLQMGAMGIVGHYLALVIGGWGIYQVLRGVVRTVFPWGKRLRRRAPPTTTWPVPSAPEAVEEDEALAGHSDQQQHVTATHNTEPVHKPVVSAASPAPPAPQQPSKPLQPLKKPKALTKADKPRPLHMDTHTAAHLPPLPMPSVVEAVVTGEGAVLEVQRGMNPTMLLALVMLLFYSMGMLAVRSRRRLMGQDEGTDTAYVGVCVESKRGKGRRVGKAKDGKGAPLDLRGELETRGLLDSLKKQQQDLGVLQDIYKRGGFYAPVLIEATGEKVALIKYLETALLSFHDTWQQVMAIADEFKIRSVGVDPRFKYSVMVPYDEGLQNDRIEALELLLQHLPKVRPSWWHMADKDKIKAQDTLVKDLKEELACRRFFREQFKEFEQTLELPSLGLQ